MLAALSGCTVEELRLPQSNYAPYQTRGDVLWAVAPLRNESGTSAVDPLATTDELVEALQQVEGIRALPVNRTLAAIRASGVEEIDSPAKAKEVAASLNADAVVVGTITAWNPYDPPEFGLNLALYAVSDAMRAADREGGPRVDPRAIQAAPTDYTLPRGEPARDEEPLSTASEHLDGANHEVQRAVRAYAEGRHDPDGPMGWRRYLASMSLFTEFACQRLAARLLDAERIRLARLEAREEISAR